MLAMLHHSNKGLKGQKIKQDVKNCLDREERFQPFVTPRLIRAHSYANAFVQQSRPLLSQAIRKHR